MRINNFGYLIKEGIRGIFLHGFMSFAAICVTVACLIIVGSFSLLTYNVNIAVEEMNRTNEVLVYIDSELSEAEARSISSKLKDIDNVWEAKFVTREQALDDFLEDHDYSDALSGVDASILRHRYVVTLEDNARMQETVKELEKVSGVAKVNASYELARGFITIQNVLQVVSIAIILVLLVISLLIISNTVKIAMHERQDEIAIMKMVGATNGFIRLPFVVEGFTLGMVGAGAAFGLEWLLYDTLVERLEEIDTLKLFSFVPFEQLLVPMVITFGAAGLFVGVLGSWTSIRKFMNV
jgi:cell division transport system permease protein